MARLTKFRLNYNTVLASEEELSKSGAAAAVGIMSAFAPSPSGGKGVKVVFPAISIHVYPLLGHIAARWPILELYIDEMTRLLTEVTGGDPDMKGIYNAKRRLAYHEEQFREAFAKHSDILSCHAEVMKMVKRVKRVRDYVGHAQIIGQAGRPEYTIRFIDHNIKGSRERRYSKDDLMKVASEISHAAGFLDALATGDVDVLPLSSQDISALQRILGVDRWTAAIGRALKIPPQASRA